MSPGEELEAGLEAAARALEAGDPIGAAEAVVRAAASCAALQASGERLPPEALARCAALQRRCEAAAPEVVKRLAGDFELASRSRRAGDAYQGR